MKRSVFFSSTALFLLLFYTGIIRADGFIILPKPIPDIPTPFPLEVKYHKVDVKIKNQVAETYIDQEFYNPSSHRLEGEYIFPIPKGAAIKNFSMYINGKETPAELLDAQKARKIYEDIVRRMKDPAILEYNDRSIFRARIYPIEPRSVKRVKISYTEIINKDFGTYKYLYPLNTEKFSSRPLNNVSVSIDLQSDTKIKSIYSTSHDIDISRKSSSHAIIGFEKNNIKPDKDFNLFYNTSDSKFGISMLTHKTKGEDGYFLLNISPGLETQNTDIIPKDIALVLDVSGSMAGEKLEQAKKALLFCINNLNKNDRFEIIKFSTEAEKLFNKLSPNTQQNINKAKNYISNLKAIGGTHIEEALEFALTLKSDSGRPFLIIFITDGKPTIGESNEDRLVKKIKSLNPSETRIFTFGIGYDINTHLLDKITEMTKSFRTYINPDEDIEIKISNFYLKVQSPILTSTKLHIPENIRATKIYPKELPDIFKGSSITLIGRYKGHGESQLNLSGTLNDKDHNFKYDANFYNENQDNDFLPQLWAARRIGYLLDQIRLHGESKELVDEVTKLARDHGIVTPYTSYLILEDEKSGVANRRIREDHRIFSEEKSPAIDLFKRHKEENKKYYEKSGASSVQASQELQQMNDAINTSQIIQGKKRMNFNDNTGKSQNFAENIKNIQGRAFYNSIGKWIDSKLQKKRYTENIRIKFASEKYFEFLNNSPGVSQFLSLGKNISFVYQEKSYEIYE